MGLTFNVSIANEDRATWRKRSSEVGNKVTTATCTVISREYLLCLWIAACLQTDCLSFSSSSSLISSYKLNVRITPSIHPPTYPPPTHLLRSEQLCRLVEGCHASTLKDTVGGGFQGPTTQLGPCPPPRAHWRGAVRCAASAVAAGGLLHR